MHCAAVLCLYLCFLSVAALGAPPTASPQPAAQDAAILPVQRVGPDDLLTIAVADLPELTRNFRVRGDGTLSLPLLKRSIAAKGKYTWEIENQISAALAQEEILVRPVVSVSVAEYRSVPVTVLGAVRHPVTFQAVGEVHLLDALTRADGLADDAGPEILISRPRLDGAPGPIQRIPVKSLMDDVNPDLNLRLQGGEEIRVPPAGRVFVLGNVKKPGGYPIQDSSDLTVMKIVAECEGLLPFASKEAYIYRNRRGNTSRSEIPIDLRQIMDRKAPDVALQANDILYIPDDKHRKLTAQTVERIAGFGMATVSGLLVFH